MIRYKSVSAVHLKRYDRITLHFMVYDILSKQRRSSNFKTKDWNTMKIQLTDKTYTVWLNNQEVMTIPQKNT